jgi:hypothetical protein
MTAGSAAAAGATRLGHTTLKLFERGVHMLIENNMAALRRELEDAGVEFIDLGRTEVPGVRLESEMGRSEMRPSRSQSALTYPVAITHLKANATET